jgi:hypothetical protein
MTQDLAKSVVDASTPLRDVVARQLDDINVLAESLVAAMNEGDDQRVRTLRISLARYTLAMSWKKDACVLAVLAYADEHAEFEDELFAPAFILKAIAPDSRETAALLEKVGQDVRTLLASLDQVVDL